MVQIPNSSAPRDTIFSDKAVTGSALKWLWFEFRASGLRLIRFAQNQFQPPFARSISPTFHKLHLLAESSTLLWTSLSAGEQHLVAGKVQNLRVAAQKLDGLILRPGEIFSFWSIIGPPTRARGFVAGRELREGCMVANVGGGLCQLSNGLHLVALEAGLHVIERHAHSRIVPGSIAETGKDATVFWNYKDLRFKSNSSCVIRVQLTRSRLIVQLLAPEILPEAPSPDPHAVSDDAAAHHHAEHAHDCVECRHRDCINFIHSTVAQPKTSLLLDAVWPEFDHWLLGQKLTDKDQALLPMNGASRNHANYHWFAGHASKPSIREHYLFTGYRAWRSRRLTSQGAARQSALLEFDTHLARIYARKIAFDSDRLIVSLPFLSMLKQKGVLGGREISVLLTRAPLLMLQEVLDTAAALYPQSKTIRDFRVSAHMAELEMEALESAHLLVTPHLGVAEYLKKHGMNHVEQLPWTTPKPAEFKATGSPGSKTVLFPASALARKGAYELRASLQDSDISLRVLGKAQEGPDFWGGRVRLDKGKAGHPLEGVSAVVLPSHWENQPRLLLQALALSIPVICTSGCGLPAQRGVSFVSTGNAEELRDVLGRICEKAD